MSDSIKPRIVDGEPVCDQNCPSHKTKLDSKMGIVWCSCFITGKGLIDGDLCIPGLRMQRDQALREQDEAKKKIKNLTIAFFHSGEFDDFTGKRFREILESAGITEDDFPRRDKNGFEVKK